MVNVLSFVVKLKAVDEELWNVVLFDLLHRDVLEEEAKTEKEVKLEFELCHLRYVLNDKIFKRYLLRVFEVLYQVEEDRTHNLREVLVVHFRANP